MLRVVYDVTCLINIIDEPLTFETHVTPLYIGMNQISEQQTQRRCARAHLILIN